MTAQGCKAVLARPDHVVYAAVSTKSELSDALTRLGQVLGV
jgi:hypothetical protein